MSGEKPMGSVYKRGKKLWIKYKDYDGSWVPQSSGFMVGQEKQARRLLENIENRIVSGSELQDGEAGPVSVKRYSDFWIKERRSLGIKSVADDEAHLRLHILPVLGKMEMATVRPRHVRQFVRNLRKGDLAPRTIRHIYGTLHNLCNDATVDEIIETSPCRLKRKDLPKNEDKDPGWRDTAVFERHEIEILISDNRIPMLRRIYYATQALAGPRVGSGLALRWKHWNPEAKPLGKLALITKYSTKRKREEPGTKTGAPIYVPVHPTLAVLLAEWKLHGWAEHMGRHPKPDDLIIPDDDGGFWDGHRSLKKFHDDLEVLELRKRRQHDLRRSFVSLARGDGAQKDVVEWMSHGPRGDIVDMYTTLPWELLCHEMKKLNIRLRGKNVVELPRAAAVNDIPVSTDLVQSLVQSRPTEKSTSAQRREKTGGGGGIRTPGTFRFNGFQDRRLRPLGHSSAAHNRNKSNILGRF
jgi:hypothetical protein